MNKIINSAILAGVLLALASTTVWAKLPPPTAEQAAQKKAAAEKKATDDEAAKKALEKAQDRVAARYKARKQR